MLHPFPSRAGIHAFPAPAYLSNRCGFIVASPTCGPWQLTVVTGEVCRFRDYGRKAQPVCGGRSARCETHECSPQGSKAMLMRTGTL